jgi:hypothetical protein
VATIPRRDACMATFEMFLSFRKIGEAIAAMRMRTARMT